MLKDLHEESVVLTMVKQHLRNTMYDDNKPECIKDYAGELYELIKDGLKERVGGKSMEKKLSKSFALKLLKEKELIQVLDKTMELAYYPETLIVEFIYNIDLDSLSIHFLKNGELDYWFLFQANKLKQVQLRKLKDVS